MSHATEDQDVASGSAADGGQVHYRETLSRSTGDTSTAKLAFGAVVALALLGGVILIPLVTGEGAGFAVFALLFLGVAGYLVYRGFGMEVDVRVVDRGVEISREGAPLGGNETVKVPFEQIRRVQYSDPVESDSHIYVKPNDAGAEWFMIDADPDVDFSGDVTGGQKPMNVYEHGVRLGLYESTPVYVGSERPIELAEAIASRAPDVERAEPLPL